MSDDKTHALSAVCLGAIFFLSHGAGPAYAAFLGAIFPDIDLIWKKWHRSWITHTALVPSLFYYASFIFPSWEDLLFLLPFFTLGVVIHVLLDFIEMPDRVKTRLPIGPALLGKRCPAWMTLMLMLIPQIPFLLYGISWS